MVDYAENRLALRTFLAEAFDDFVAGHAIRVLMSARTVAISRTPSRPSPGVVALH